MKRFILALLLLLVAVPCFSWPEWSANAVITVASDNNTSAAVTLPSTVTRIALQVPTIDSGTISIYVSLDGTTYQELYCPVSAAGASVIWTTASGTGLKTFEVPCNMGLWKYLKLETSAQQTSNRTIVITGGR